MHLSFITRGHKEWVDKFINELSTRYLSFKWYNQEKKQLENRILQMRVCPVQLWDISFPKEHYDAVANTILRGTGDKSFINSHAKYIWGLRKIMKMKKIPEYKKEQWLTMASHENINIIGIGVKDDYWITEDGRHVKEKDKTPLSWEGI